MSYTVGQAVIDCLGRIGFIDREYDLHYGYRLVDIKGEAYFCPNIERPATESEILSEAAKHGWDVDGNTIDSPLEYLRLLKTPKDGWFWMLVGKTPPQLEISKYGKECIVADTLIKALNLAK